MLGIKIAFTVAARAHIFILAVEHNNAGPTALSWRVTHSRVCDVIMFSQKLYNLAGLMRRCFTHECFVEDLIWFPNRDTNIEHPNKLQMTTKENKDFQKVTVAASALDKLSLAGNYQHPSAFSVQLPNEGACACGIHAQVYFKLELTIFISSFRNMFDGC